MAVNLADLNFYRAVNPDLAGLNDPEAFSHLINAGLNEGRVFSPYIDLNLYRAVNTDLAAAGLTSNRQLYDHLQNAGVAEGRTFSPVFEANFYRAVHPDLAAAGLNNEQLLDHFRGFGINEGRASTPNFHVSFYIAANPDLQAAGFNFQQALQHYVFAGIREGRIAAPTGPDVGDPPPPLNSTLSFAKNLGVLPDSFNIRDFVGTDDSNDYYRFTLASNGDLDLTIGPLTRRLMGVELIKDLNQNGEIDIGDDDVISTIFADAVLNGNINRAMEAGTYYLLVYPIYYFPDTNTTYDLRFRFSPKPSTIPANLGNTLNNGVVDRRDSNFIVESFADLSVNTNINRAVKAGVTNDSSIQNFTATGNPESDLTGGLGTVTADSLINESFAGENELANLLAANSLKTPDFSQSFALI